MRKKALLLGASLFAMYAGRASAEGSPASPGHTDAGAGQLDTIVVTAQKSTQNLQKVSAAVTTVSGAALDHAGIASVSDLNAIAPGLVVNNTPGNALTLTIRGAGYEGVRSPSAQPGVSLNENGVYITSVFAANANFLDVDQIEVLRGPQGTVLGQNSDGGALNITTVQPVLGKFSGDVNASYGSFDYDRIRAAVNIPLGNDFAARAAFEQQKDNGATVATGVPGNPNYKLGNEDSYNGRLTLLWKPSSRLRVTLWGEVYQNHANDAAYKNIYDPNPNPYVVTQDYAGKIVQRTAIVAGRVSYDLDFATLDGIASYQHAYLAQPNAQDKLDFVHAIAIYGVHDIAPLNTQETNSTTQEVDLRSRSGGRIDWIVGAFSLQQHYRQGLLEYQDKQNRSVYPVDLSNPTAIFGTGALAFESSDTNLIVSSSLYAQGTYHFTDRLRLTAGVRGTHDRQVGHVSVFFQPNVTLKTGYTAATGKVSLEYDVLPTSMVYAMWSSGMKPGGNNLNPAATFVPTTFKPETVHAFEAGLKNQFFDRRVRFNVSAFYNLYHNLQVDSEDPVPYEGGLTNVQRSHIYGLELEGTALLPAGFRIDASGSVMRGRVDSHQQMFDPVVAQQINLANGGPFAGNDLVDRLATYNSASSDIHGRIPPKVPDYSAHVSLSDTQNIGHAGSVTAMIGFNYISRYNFRIYNNPATDIVPTYEQWELGLTYETPDKRYYAELTIKNLTNTASVLTRYTDNFGVGAIVDQYVLPRQFIGRIGVRF